MAKAIIFDYGGVITSGGGGNEPAERLASHLHISVERAKGLFYQNWSRFITGEMNEDEYWHEVEANYGESIPAQHRNIWNTWEDMSPRPEVIAYIQRLKSRGYLVGLLSNTIPITESIIREQGGYDLFEPCLLSCELGYAKPDRAIYDELLRQLTDVEPSEIVFVDDQQRCLDPAKSLGIKTVLAKNAMQIIHDVDALLEDHTA